ncbi:hypothetical protein F4777DRAFT_159126 [Nemania sp. FL0916]|nr:hypothetical protein F4777DRAFT_159126 [Nemania sp. FL0916]
MPHYKRSQPIRVDHQHEHEHYVHGPQYGYSDDEADDETKAPSHRTSSSRPARHSSVRPKSEHSRSRPRSERSRSQYSRDEDDYYPAAVHNTVYYDERGRPHRAPPRHRSPQRHRSPRRDRGERRSHRDHRDHRDYRDHRDHRERRERRGRREPEEEKPDRIMQAAKAGLEAAGLAAFRLRKEPGGWSGDKAIQIATAALGAAAVETIVDKDPRADKKRGFKGFIETAASSFIMGKLFEGAERRFGRDRRYR